MKYLFTLILTLFTLVSFAQTSDVLEPLDIFDMELVGDPQISPDGSKIVYVRNFKDIMTDGNRSNLWIINSDGTGHRPLTSGNQNDYAPRWSPDGSRLAYVSSMDGKPQIYMYWMKEGASAKITNLQQSPRSMQWSPDGKKIALIMTVKEEQKRFNVLPPKPKGAKWADPPIYIDEMKYRADGRGYLEVSYSQIFLLAADGGTPRQMTDGEYNHNGISWAPDSKSIIFSANHHGNEMEPRNSEIHELILASGDIKTLTKRFGPDGSPKISPDGTKIAYLGQDDNFDGYQVGKLYVMNRDGSGSKMLCDDLDRDIGNINWSADGKSIVFQYDHHGNTYVSKTDMNGKRTQLAENLGGLSLGRPYSAGTYSMAKNGNIAFTLGTTEHPADLAIAMGGKSKRLTWGNEDLIEYQKLCKVE
ncbi:MAG: PD40 domain-containing protein, partial [Bacteroidia bacterium]|nr:PD40 domain-containing protein [Bacteroidia bacterium]